ncbi:hypothetical protein AB0E88_35390 [Streptomyces sp. NPDC028635]|uniref:hypothetical protein n=1 Tax=Streptomyces sp. NPDC028635 TaxID=3154800 RepID=UPI0033FCDCB7
MTTLLEKRYRAVLRLLPAYYRAEREEEMVEVFLWDVDRDTQDQSRPTLGEAASIAGLALRTRLGAAGAPRRYALLGSAVRQFALFAVLLQAAGAVADRVLEVTWAATHGPAQWRMFLSGLTGPGGTAGTVAALAQWILPLLWTAGYFALLHDRRRLARAAVLLAALPTLWLPLAPLVSDAFPPDPAYATAAALLAWLTALAVCAAHHRDAPPAALPVGTPGLAHLACCVVAGASLVLMPGTVDTVWAPSSCFVVGVLGWLLWRGRRRGAADAGTAAALTALGLLVFAARVAALYPWLAVPLPGALLAGLLVQTGAVLLLTAAPAVVGGRCLGARGGER